ncbi:hypothetical protein [Sanguibacter sp. 25GB23B1]|uniref:hypothetical protein n=1 Tax=unclassified Sanguibacter TaxID=2645534 RepID=UPI0032AEB3EB
MDDPRRRRAVRESRLAGAMVLVLMVCVAVAGTAIVLPWAPMFDGATDTACVEVTVPDVVREDPGLEWEHREAVTSTSYLPHGPRCTWTLSDGSTVSTGPGWTATVALLGSVGVAAGTLVLFVRALRRPD